MTHALEGAIGTAAAIEVALALGGDRGRAAGLDRHPGLAAWPLPIPTLGERALVDAPRVGLGLDVDAALACARRHEVTT
ncbi:MAG: hypothetical protein H6709_16450 [Kofleriaceae bacterium]|nr:hypothetical protein [Kofleriaceae bacterium]